MKTKLLFSYFKQNCNLLHGFLKRFATFFLFSILFFSSKTFAQINSGTAPVITPTGGFATNGSLKANTNVGDWLQGTGSGGYVLDGTNAGNPINASNTFHLVDLYNSGMDDNFKAGFEVKDNPNNWKWVRNPVNNKQDINNALVHFSKDINGHLWVVVAADRLSTNGDAYIDFEFLQNKLTINSDGSFTSAGPNGGRTVGDFILTLQLTNGGSSADFYVERWESGSGGFNYVDRTSALPVGSTFAAVNNTAVPVTFDAFGSHTYAANAFAEAAVDLTALIGNFGACNELGIKSLFIKTKESQSPTATIVDFIGPSLPVDVTIGVADAGRDQAKCSGGAETIFNLTGTATPPANTTVASTIWSFASGTGTIDNESTLTPTVHVTSGSAKLVLTVTTTPSICSPAVSDTVLLTVTGAPTIYNLSPGNYCAGEMTHGSITLSGSQAGVSYQLYDADNNIVQAAKPGTGDALMWTDISAGSYYIIASADGNCSSTTLSTSITENPLPGTPTADVINPTCTKATGTITITSPTGEGFTYSINGTDYQSDPTFNDVASGTYTMYVMNGTGCISSADTKIDPAPTTLTKPAATVVDPTCTVATGTVTVTDPLDGITYTLSQNGSVKYTAVNGVFNNVVPGTYAFTASNGTCSATGDDVVVKDQPSSPTVSADPKFVCTGSTVALTGLPNGGNWSGNYVTGNTFDATGLPAGPYKVTYVYTNEAGCRGSADATVTVNALPVVSVSPDVPICNGSSTTLMASGATSYLWLPDIGLNTTTGASVNANPSITTTYYVTGTDDNKCSNTASVKVTVNSLPAATISGGSFCKTGTTQLSVLTGQTGGTFSASPSGLSISGSGLINLAASTPGNYNVMYSFSNGICSNTTTSSVTVKPLPTASIAVSAQNCTSGIAKFTLTATTNGSITWSTNGDGSFSSTSAANTIYTPGNNDKAKGVTITLTTGLNSCTNTATTKLTVSATVCPAVYTYTQGYYSGTGTSCTPVGGLKGGSRLIAYAINNMPNKILYIGSAGHSFTARVADSAKLMAIMPGGGTAAKLAKDYNLTTTASNPPLKKGKIDNVLLSQTITLALNVNIQGDALGTFILQSGYLTTQKGDLSTCPVSKVVLCSKDGSSISSLKVLTTTGLITALNGKTVNDLLNLASAVLGGAALPSGVTLTDINNAVDVINRSFDGGRFILGYYNTQQSCSTLSSSVIASASASRPIVSQLSVKAYPNPYSSAITFTVASPVSGKALLEMYDLTGKKLAIVYEGTVDSGTEHVIKYNVPAGNKIPMMYKLTIGSNTSHGILIPQK